MLGKPNAKDDMRDKSKDIVVERDDCTITAFAKGKQIIVRKRQYLGNDGVLAVFQLWGCSPKRWKAPEEKPENEFEERVEETNVNGYWRGIYDIDEDAQEYRNHFKYSNKSNPFTMLISTKEWFKKNENGDMVIERYTDSRRNIFICWKGNEIVGGICGNEILDFNADDKKGAYSVEIESAF